MELSLKIKLMSMFFILIMIPLAVLGAISYKMAANSLQQTIGQQVAGKTEDTADKIGGILDTARKNLQIASYNNGLAACITQNNDEIKSHAYEFISRIQKENSDTFETIFLADANGKTVLNNQSMTDDTDLSDREYIKKALTGAVAVSDVVISRFSSKPIVAVAYPIKEGEKVVGVLSGTIDFNMVEQILAKVKIGESGYAYMINKEGFFIYHPKKEKILKENLGDTDNQQLKAIVENMKSGKAGEGFYTYEGVYKYVRYRPFNNGWTLAVTANYADYMASALSIKDYTLAVTAAFIVIAMLLAYFLSTFSIVNPIKKLQILMDKAGNGDLTVKSAIKNKDEIGKLGNSFNLMISRQAEIVREVRNGSHELAAASEETAAASEQINSAAQQITASVHEVAAGAEKQNGSILEVSKALVQLSSLVQLAKSKTLNTYENSENALQTAQLGRDKVKESVQAMDTISQSTSDTAQVLSALHEKSQKVGGIVTTINAIAGQTNLLALNAAIEAARAGEHGKGFSIVAEQVRKLSEESNMEAKQISDLMSEMVKEISMAVSSMDYGRNAVENGVRIVDEMDESFKEIISAMEQIVKNTQEIVDITRDEVASSDEIIRLIDTVATITETTLANSEEVLAAVEEQTSTIESLSASAEESSAMAGNLDNLVKVFQVD